MKFCLNALYILLLAVCLSPCTEAAESKEDEDENEHKQLDDSLVMSALTGYDIFKGNPFVNGGADPGWRRPIFNISPKEKADAIKAFPRLACAVEAKTTTILTMEAYTKAQASSSTTSLDINKYKLTGYGAESQADSSLREMSLHMEIPHPFEHGGGEQSFETSDHLRRFFAVEKGAMMVVEAQCVTHQVAIDYEYAGPLFTAGFVRMLKLLSKASKFSERMQMEFFRAFVRRYGTHFSQRTSMGAKLVYVLRISEEERTALSEEEIRQCAIERASKVFGVSFGRNNGIACDDASSLLRPANLSIARFTATTFGTQPPQQGDLFEWAKELEEPMPVQMHFTRISKLFTNRNLKFVAKGIDQSALVAWFLRKFARYCYMFGVKCPNKFGCGLLGDTCRYEQVCLQLDKKLKCAERNKCIVLLGGDTHYEVKQSINTYHPRFGICDKKRLGLAKIKIETFRYIQDTSGCFLPSRMSVLFREQMDKLPSNAKQMSEWSTTAYITNKPSRLYNLSTGMFEKAKYYARSTKPKPDATKFFINGMLAYQKRLKEPETVQNNKINSLGRGSTSSLVSGDASTSMAVCVSCGGLAQKTLNETTSTESTDSCYAYSLGSERPIWTVIDKAPMKLAYAASTAIRGKFILVGGIDEQKTSSDRIYYYDLKTEKWNEWSKLRLMTARYMHAAVRLDDGHVLVCGGRNNQSGEGLKSCEIVDLEKQIVLKASSMKSPRSLFSIVEFSGYFYAIGGDSINADGKTVERYNHLNGKWENVGHNLNSAITRPFVFVM